MLGKINKKQTTLFALIGFLFIVSVNGGRIIPMEPSEQVELSSYEITRNAFKKANIERFSGYAVELNEKEMLVDEIIKKLKSEEISVGFKNQSLYPPAIHFFRAKRMIEKSKIFDIMKMIPKGSALHIHNSAGVSSEWIIKNLTYRSETSYCHNKNGQVIFVVSTGGKCVDEIVNIVQERKRKSPAEVLEYDNWLEQQITLYSEEPCVEFSSLEKVWIKFQSLFDAVVGLTTYLPFYKAYHYRMLEEHYDDGVYYMEMRASFKNLIDKDGKPYDSVKATLEVAQEFAATHPDFVGLKAIYGVYRNLSLELMEQELNKYKKIAEEHSNFLIGLDFVGQEDMISLLDIKNKIEKKIPRDTALYFHAGETNWWGTEADMNLLDAVLMSSRRIGHAYALLKHPMILEMVRSRSIAIEVSVISNQVLNLVTDLRNHPAAIYLATNMPVIITNDDPTFWGAKALSYDWYLAFMAFTPADAGLKILKQLATDSIDYSSVPGDEYKRLHAVFKKNWDLFVHRLLNKYSHLLSPQSQRQYLEIKDAKLSYY